MTERLRRAAFFGALSGIGYVVLVFLGSAVIGGTSGAGRHSLDASLNDVSEYVRGADKARAWAGEYVAVLGYALFLVFAAYVWSALADRDHTNDWGRATSMAAAAIYVALAVAATACLAPVLNRPGDPDGAARFLDLRSVLFGLAFVFFGLWLLGVGARVLRTRGLPRWLGWAAIVIGVLQLIGTPFGAYDPGFTGVPTFAGFLWVAIVSVMLALRARARTPAAA